MLAETTNLGGETIPRLGFGCWQLGGHGWQDLDAKALDQSVRDALDMGANFFDPADVYGLGHSEATLGEILKSHPKGKDAIVATKFAVRFIDGKRVYDNSPEYIAIALEASRKRLQRDKIDLYQMHWHDGTTDLRVIFDALESARAKGHIQNYGVCNIDLNSWKKADLPEGLAAFSLEYSLMNRAHERNIRNMQALGLTFLSWGSLAQGLLSGKYARNHKFAADDVRSRDSSLFAERHWNRYEPILAALKTVADSLNKPMSQIALRWIMDTIGGVALSGIKNPQQLRDNAAAFGWKLPFNAVKSLTDISK